MDKTCLSAAVNPLPISWSRPGYRKRDVCACCCTRCEELKEGKDIELVRSTRPRSADQLNLPLAAKS